jgi:uncharacterized protein YdeI (BOF family)
LLNWKIKDASGDSYTFEQSKSIAPHAVATFPRTDTAVVLNNKNETLQLIAPNGDVVDTVVYASAPNGQTYERTGETWGWSGEETTSTSTSSTAVVLASSSTQNTPSTQLASSSTTTTLSSQAATRAVSYPAVSIAGAKSLADKSRAQIQGSVIALPGAFGRQVFYLMDETGGIQVYFYDGTFPTMSLDQKVRVRGELSTSHGERRLKAGTVTDIVPMNENAAVRPVETTIENIADEQTGALITLDGQVQSLSENKLVIEQGNATLVVNLKSNPTIDANQYERGDKLIVTGVLTRYDEELRIRPRANDDVVVKESATSVSAATSQNSGLSLSQEIQSQAGILLLVSTVVALCGFALLYMRKRQAALSAS